MLLWLLQGIIGIVVLLCFFFLFLLLLVLCFNYFRHLPTYQRQGGALTFPQETPPPPHPLPSKWCGRKEATNTEGCSGGGGLVPFAAVVSLNVHGFLLVYIIFVGTPAWEYSSCSHSPVSFAPFRPAIYRSSGSSGGGVAASCAVSVPKWEKYASSSKEPDPRAPSSGDSSSSASAATLAGSTTVVQSTRRTRYAMFRERLTSRPTCRGGGGGEDGGGGCAVCVVEGILLVACFCCCCCCCQFSAMYAHETPLPQCVPMLVIVGERKLGQRSLHTRRPCQNPTTPIPCEKP